MERSSPPCPAALPSFEEKHRGLTPLQEETLNVFGVGDAATRPRSETFGDLDCFDNVGRDPIEVAGAAYDMCLVHDPIPGSRLTMPSSQRWSSSLFAQRRAGQQEHPR